MIIVIAFKGAVQVFLYNRLTVLGTISNRYAQVAHAQFLQITCNTSSAYYVQHVLLRAKWYEGTVQLLSFTGFKSH